jgi:hypothetical protein
MSTTNTAKISKPGLPPVAKLRIGKVKANIWERKSNNGTFYSVTFERGYKDADGHWQTTDSFDTADLLALAKLADQAHTRILEIRNSEDE